MLSVSISFVCFLIIGLYIGLTGKACNARDLIDLGLATHYFPSDKLSQTIEKYIEEENLNQSNFQTVFYALF